LEDLSSNFAQTQRQFNQLPFQETFDKRMDTKSSKGSEMESRKMDVKRDYEELVRLQKRKNKRLF
jgi:hypothetical protein